MGTIRKQLNNMITETMPLNEWPIELLKNLEIDLEVAYKHWSHEPEKPYTATLMVLNVVKKAIKDVEFEQSKS